MSSKGTDKVLLKYLYDKICLTYVLVSVLSLVLLQPGHCGFLDDRLLDKLPQAVELDVELLGVPCHLLGLLLQCGVLVQH